MMGKKAGFSRSESSITHRTPRYIWIVTTVLFVVVLAMTVMSFLVGLEWWYRLGFTLFSFLFLWSFVELRTRRVSLDSSSLTIVSDCRRRVLKATEVESVTWGGGVGVSVKLVDGTWVELPEVGSGSQGLTNSVRAWIKRAATSSQ